GADARNHIISVDLAVAERHVALPTHCDASHPAMHAVAGCIGALLIDRVSISGPSDLIPAHTGDTRRRLNRLVSYQRLVILEVPVSEAPGRPLPIGQDVKEAASIGNPRIGQTVTGRRLRS